MIGLDSLNLELLELPFLPIRHNLSYYIMEDVLNNHDLRKIIWSYLRKTPYKTCYECGCVCMWDENKTITDYINLGDNIVSCCRCFGNIILFHTLLCKYF